MGKDETQLLNAQRSAIFLGVNANTIRRWAKTRKLKGIKVGTRGDWRFTKDELLKMVQKEPEAKHTKRTYSKIKKFLRENANDLQRLATKHHKVLLETDSLRSEFLSKYQKIHIKILKLLATNLDDTEKGLAIFKKLGEQFAKEAVKDRLTIEEAVDGTIFLKQAIWEKLEQGGLLDELSSRDLNRLSKIMAAYIDVLSSTIAFTYHEYYKQQILQSKEQSTISEKRHQRLMESTNVIPWEADGETGKFIYVGPQAKKMLGYPIDAWYKDTFWPDHIHPEDREWAVKFCLDAMKIKQEYEFEYRMTTKDGRTIWLRDIVSVTTKEDGKKLLTGFLLDITERKQLQDNLAYLAEASKVLSSSLDYKTTLSNIAKLAVPRFSDWCAVDLLNGEGELEQVAVAHKDPKKLKWAKELRKVDPPKLNDPSGVPKVIRTGKSEYYPVITNETLVKLAKNKKHLQLLRNLGFTSAIVVPLCREGKCVGGMTFVTTETKRNYTETDLKIVEELANRASIALENAGLYKASQDAVTLRDNFISVASHELKTPITSVKIFTEVLQQHSEQIGDQKAVAHLTKMNKQLDKLTELIYNMLNISKIQAGRLEFHEKLFDLDTAVAEIVDVLQQGATKHKLIIEGKTHKKVYGDEDRIGQVLSNLIANAIKYSPKADKVIIHLSTDRRNVIVCVEDFGIGLATEHVGHIFERFYRVFDEADKTFPGLGIGLYISSEIIKRHHGKLWVESEPGKGSRFYFSLPLTRDKKPNGAQIL